MKKSPVLNLCPLFISLILVLFNGCAPIFSEMQSARTVGKGNIELSGGLSFVSFTEDRETDHVQNHIGLQAAYGLSDAVDLRARYEYLWIDDDGGKANIFGLGPKFSLLTDRIAGYLPIGFAFGEDIEDSSDSWQIHPTLLVSIPVVDFLEINPSGKVLIPFHEDGETLIAFNLGLGLSLNNRLTIRPEYGMLFNPGESGHFGQFSIGFTINPAE